MEFEERTLALNVPLGTQALLGRRSLNHAEAQDHVQWAENLFLEDIDSTSVNFLAGLEPPFNWFDVDKYFQRALKELQVAIQPKDDLIHEYAREVAKYLIDGKVAPTDGLNILYQICIDTEYDSQYECWSIFDDERYDLGNGGLPENFFNREKAAFDKKIIREAISFLATDVK